MKYSKLILPFLIVISLFITACSAPTSTTNATDSSEVTMQSTASDATKSSSSATSSTSNPEETELAEQTKDYLMNGQTELPEADQLKWSEAFLNQVNIETVYQDYISAGGEADDIERFAEYLTQNAPVPTNWKALFEADLLNTYGEKVSRYESLEDNLYQVYVQKDGADVPYVVVNARTGYFHG